MPTFILTELYVVDLFFLFIMYIFGIVGSWGNDKKLLMYSDVSTQIAFFFSFLKYIVFSRHRFCSVFDYQPAPVSLLSPKQNFSLEK